MLSFLIILALSTNTVDSIRKQISNKQYNQAFQASNSLILQQGALDADSILFFLRGSTSVKIGKYSQGISDLSRFLRSSNISPKDQKESFILRCIAYLKIGNIEDAQKDADYIKDESLIKLVRKASFLLNSAQSNESTPQFSLNKYLELIKICPSSEVFLREAATIALSLNNNTLFVDLSQKALTISPNDARLLELKGRYHFSNAEIPIAQKFARMCINSAASPLKCTELLRSINSFQINEKNATNSIAKKDFDNAQKHIDSCREIVNKYAKYDSPLSNRVKRIHVDVLLTKNKKDEAIEYFNDLIKASPNDIKLLTQRGELLLDLGDYSGAISDFQIVKKNTKPNSNEHKKIIKLIEKASTLEEKEKNVDYYTILGLKRGASMNDVKSAYRKMVIKWHPDRFKEPLKKKEAEKKMKMINRAYDVLSDEEKKKMYDLGQDPDNQMPNNNNDYNYYNNHNAKQNMYNNFKSSHNGRTTYTRIINGNKQQITIENLKDLQGFQNLGGFGGPNGFDINDIFNIAMNGNPNVKRSTHKKNKK